MKRALFVNGWAVECGVHSFGVSLFDILRSSTQIAWEYWDEPTPPPQDYQTILFNWSPLMGGWPSEYRKGDCSTYLCYHDGGVDESRWDGIFFADPTFNPPNSKWTVIGRPLPKNSRSLPDLHGSLAVGVHGFLGAWADQVVHRVLDEFEYATIKLSLPHSHFCDPNGDSARAMADRCRGLVSGSGIKLCVSHDFLERDTLLTWLSTNHINCYIRPDNIPWRGVSSAPDFALACGRPLAVNKCQAFRHLHTCSPSICVEDSSLSDILSYGLSPTLQFKRDWCDPDKIKEQIESVILCVNQA